MRIIKTNSINSIAASSSNSAYPVTNLLDSSPKKKWQAASASVNSATLTLETSGKTGSIGIVGIQATAADVIIEDPNGIIWSNVVWSNVVWDTTPNALTVSQTWQNVGSDFATLWVDFDQFNSSVSIVVTLYKTADNPVALGAGVLKVGEPIRSKNPSPDIREGLEDYSTERMLSNGSFYYGRRDIVRTFTANFVMDRELEVMVLFRDIARVYGKEPMMIQLVDSLSGDWVIYGRFMNMPEITHINRYLSRLTLQLIEVL